MTYVDIIIEDIATLACPVMAPCDAATVPENWQYVAFKTDFRAIVLIQYGFVPAWTLRKLK